MLDTDEELSLLKINLLTGRHHQIRVQLAKHGLPIWGDTKYNPSFSNTKIWTQIELWAFSLKFRHPNGKKKIFYSYPEKDYPWDLFSTIINNLELE